MYTPPSLPPFRNQNIVAELMPAASCRSFGQFTAKIPVSKGNHPVDGTVLKINCLLGFPLDMGVMVMPLAMGLSGRLSGKVFMSLGASGRSPGGVRPLPEDFIVMGGGTNTVRT